MQIKINIKILLFIGIFLISGQIEIYGIFMLFALIHELGHLLVGILLGLKLDYLTIMPLGLSITFKTGLVLSTISIFILSVSLILPT